MTLPSITTNLGCAALSVLSNALLKHTLQGQIVWKGSVSNLFSDSINLARAPLFWLGVLSFVSANLTWLYILGTQRMSVAYPIQLSLVLVLTSTTGCLFFSERVSAANALGIILILGGISLITRP
jgi:multidrug transporter EmrE-like cation transporter